VTSVDSHIEIVLFDLGGVLVDLGGVGPMKELSAIDTDDEFWDRWLTCRWVRGFERGECTADEFAAGIVEDWGLAADPSVFLEAFQDWPGRMYAGAESLVKAVHAKVPIGFLSNTNALHWDRHFGTWPILEHFDYRFLSYELGVVKPDRELFEQVAAILPAPPEHVLFLDDNLVNVNGAIDVGLVARHVRGVDGARAALAEEGVIGDRPRG
jgi:putative hydrolase of the HAD superfamily